MWDKDAPEILKQLAMNGWWGAYDAEEEDDELDDDEFKQLLLEFEKMLNDEPNDYERMSKQSRSRKESPDKCYHVWEKVGVSPVLNLDWYNCKKCGIKKETYEKSLKFR